ncbi:hypothetical protein SLA2020_084060 [Shorea laevis]
MISLYNEDKVILANFVIRKLRILPNSCISPCSELEYRSIIAMGFGYDPKTNEYKVVRVYSDNKMKESNFPPQRRAEVYSLSLDSWKVIDDVAWEVCFRLCFHLQRYWNGAYYWFGCASDHHREVIALFDMTSEVFHYMTLPESFCKFPGQ